jgi:hypothetical protein
MLLNNAIDSACNIAYNSGDTLASSESVPNVYSEGSDVK